MPTIPPLPRPLGDGPFHVGEAAELGVGRSRLRRHDLVAPFHGVRAPAPALADRRAATPSDRDRARLVARCAAYAPLLGDGRFFADETAALLHRLPLPRRVERAAELHVGVHAPARAPRGAGVRGHCIEPAFGLVVTVEPRRGLRLPALAPIETWFRLAARTGASALDGDALIAVGDALVNRRNPHATLEQLREAVATHAGRRGHRRIVVALDSVRPRTDSPKETELRLLIVRAGLPEPAVNPPVLSRDGEFIGYFDLVYWRQRVLIEYDGDHHRTDRAQYEHDIDRIERAMADGWRVIRVNRAHLAEEAERVLLIGRIMAALAAR